MKCFVNDWLADCCLGKIYVNEVPELGNMLTWEGKEYKICQVIYGRQYTEDYIEDWCSISLDLTNTWLVCVSSEASCIRLSYKQL